MLLTSPHPITGFVVTGSPDNQSNNRSSTRAHVDCFIHTCPHCSCGIAIGGSPDTKINNLPAHRNTDIVTDFCGVSVSVTSSPDMRVNES